VGIGLEGYVAHRSKIWDWNYVSTLYEP